MNAVQEFISITPWTIIFQICNLLILFVLIKKFLFKRVMDMLDARQQEIDGIYDAAGKDRDEAAQMKAEYAERMSSARDEATHLKQKAESDIEQERRKAYSELVGEISGMAVDIAGRMVEREINEADHRDLVEEFIRNAGEAS